MCANHYSLAGNAQMQHSKISHPLLSPRIYDVLFTLPSGLRAANTIHKNIIHSYCPSLEKIPLDNSGFQVPYHGYQYLRYLPQLYERFIVPPAGKYFPKLGSFLSVQHSPYTLSMIVSSSPEKLQEIAFSESKHFDQYFSKSAIEKLDVFNPRMVAVATAKILLQEHCR